MLLLHFHKLFWLIVLLGLTSFVPVGMDLEGPVQSRRVAEALSKIPPYKFLKSEECLRDVHLVLERVASLRVQSQNGEPLLRPLPIRKSEAGKKQTKQRIYEISSLNADVVQVFLEVMASAGVTKTPSVDALSFLHALMYMVQNCLFCMTVELLNFLGYELWKFHLVAGFPYEHLAEHQGHIDAHELKPVFGFLRRKWKRQERPRDPWLNSSVLCCKECV